MGSEASQGQVLSHDTVGYASPTFSPGLNQHLHARSHSQPVREKSALKTKQLLAFPAFGNITWRVTLVNSSPQRWGDQQCSTWELEGLLLSPATHHMHRQQGGSLEEPENPETSAHLMLFQGGSLPGSHLVRISTAGIVQYWDATGLHSHF